MVVHVHVCHGKDGVSLGQMDFTEDNSLSHVIEATQDKGISLSIIG